jgi:hypothetical protein
MKRQSLGTQSITGPAAFLDLASMYFYLSVAKREFMQQMQMT